jgi:choline dehydrogenase-like flavoprotein
MVSEITVDAGGKVTGVVYQDAGGHSQRIEARCVVVAASAIESARLLLMSTSSRFPHGLANGNGLVGKNIVYSSLAKGLALFDRKSRPWLADPVSPFVNRAMQDFYYQKDATGGARKAGTLLFLLGHANPIANVERISHERGLTWGKALKDKLRAARGQLRLEVETFSEFLPSDRTFVDLDPEMKDRFGLPVARMTVEHHPFDLEGLRLLRDRGMEVLRGLEPDVAEPGEADGTTLFLQGGTCRFGKDPASSVLDADCRAHEVPNLYVSDGSFMPTSGGVPLTLTIVANAFRVGERLAQRFKRSEM